MNRTRRRVLAIVLLLTFVFSTMLNIKQISLATAVYEEDSKQVNELDDLVEEPLKENFIPEHQEKEDIIKEEDLEESMTDDSGDKEIDSEETLTDGALIEELEDKSEEVDLIETESNSSSYPIVPPAGNNIVSNKKTTLVPGVVETELVYNNSSGSNPVSGFLVDVNLGKNVNIMVASKDYNQRGLQTVRDMIHATEQKTGRNIIVGINADLNWIGKGESEGPQIIDGVIHSDIPGRFFGIKKDGKAIIGDEDVYRKEKLNLEQAVFAKMGWLVKDGKIATNNTSLAPRTAVGLRADGSVFFYVVEGRMYPRSVGISLIELANIMKSYGAVNALNLDGGGSSTYFAKKEGQNEIDLRNIPSDGVERTSISSILVYAEAGDGNFNHAAISTEDEIYTPKSEVQFTALGVDNAGGAADLPEELNWKLVDNSFGNIDNTGKFVSNGKEGVVSAYLEDVNGENVGQGSVEIRKPDEIHFSSDEFSLGFNASTTFGLRLTYKQRPVVFKDGDIIWEYDPSLGVIKNNEFTSNPDLTIEDKTIKATIAGTEIYKEISVIIGKLPIVVFDFEDDKSNEQWVPSVVGKGEKSALSIVNRDSGEPVRFGNKALRIDFDFSGQPISSNPGGAYAGFDGTGLDVLDGTFDLPGSPVTVGMWVYGTEEAQGLWLRLGMTYKDGPGWNAYNLTEETKGIDWLGWKYVETEFPINHTPPYKIIPSQFIRFMTTINQNPRIRPVGNVYVDDITITYGTNPQDLDAPIIDYINVNDETLEDNQVLNTNNITIETSYSDVENENSKGIDYEKVSIYVDGVNYKDLSDYGWFLDITYNKAYLQNIYLTDGVHEIKVVVIDKAGNETSESRFITMDTSTENKVYLEHNENVIIGSDYTIALKADEIEKIESTDLSLQISNNLSNYKIEFSEAFEGTVEYLPGVRFLNIKANRKSDAPVDYIFKITMAIGDDLTNEATVRFTVNRGEFSYKSDDTDTRFLKSFSHLPQNISVVAPLRITSNPILLGDDGIFTVTDLEGNPIEKAEVFLVKSEGNESLGFTDEKGNLTTDKFSNEVVSFTLMAKFEDVISFEYKGQSFDSFGELDGSPYNIITNGTSKPETNKSITWISNARSDNKDSYIQYALKSDYDLKGESALVQEKASNGLYTFDGARNVNENYSVLVNNAEISGLGSGKDYVYRVGNGVKWSELRTFKTMYEYSGVKFLVLGDIQTTNYENIAKSVDYITNDGVDYDFSIQIGDFIDQAGIFGQWDGILSKITDTTIGNLDMINVLGNHEFYGDLEADRAGAIFNLPENKDYYSTVYGNVYIATINYTMNRDDLTEALEWLVKDANASKARWRILTTHQPPYYTNPMGGNELFNELVPQFVEKAGMDIVFSGHDHSYARTEPLLNGTPDENGVVYINAAALGEKRYGATNNPDFHFAKTEENFDSIYLSVDTSHTEFTIKVYETTTGRLIDTYTKTKEDSDDHNYYIIDDRLVCFDCKYSRPIGDYTGYVKTVNEETMYLLNGEVFKGIIFLGDKVKYFDEDTGVMFEGDIPGFIKTKKGTFYLEERGLIKHGWHDIDGDLYYFSLGKDGYMKTGKANIDGEAYEFTSDGKLIGDLKFEYGFIKTPDGTYWMDMNKKRLHGWQEIDGYTYYFSTGKTGYMRTGKTSIDGVYYEFTEDGKLIGEIKAETGFIETPNGTYYLQENGKILHGWQEIDGYTYYFSTGKTGYMRTGKTSIDGVYYEFTEDGKLIEDTKAETGFIETPNGTYYLQENGKILHGWQEIDGYTYYFSTGKTGYMRTGKTSIDGVYYEFTEDGKLIGKAK